MNKTLIVLAVAATTAYAQTEVTLTQRDGCFWQCESVDGISRLYGDSEICWDTCTPKLSRFTDASGDERVEAIYDNNLWQDGFDYQVWNFAIANEEERVYEFLKDYHTTFSVTCQPWWQCDWEACDDSENDGSGDECWKQNCYEDCGTEDDICRIWHARYYDYSWNQWTWDIQECDSGFDGSVNDGQAYIEDNFEGTVDQIGEMLNDENAMMTSNAVANIIEDNSIDMGAMRVGETLSSVLDSFYANKDAVTLANEFVTEGGYAWGLPADQLDVVINADSSEALANQASNAVNQNVQGSAFEDEDEQDSKWNDWISTFVSGLMNRSDERKGERDDDWSNDKYGKDNWDNDMKDDKKDWNNDMKNDMSADSKDWNNDMKNDMSTDSKDWNNDMKNDMSTDSKDWNDDMTDTKDSMGETGKKGNF